MKMIGIAPKVAVPAAVKSAGNPTMLFPPVSAIPIPEYKVIVPSVAISEGTPNLVINFPLKYPRPVETAIAEIKKQAEAILDSVRTVKKPAASKSATMVPAIRPDSKIGPMVGELMQSDEFDDIPIFPPSDCEPVEFERLNEDPFSGLEQGAVGAEAPADVPQRMHRARSARPAAQVAYQGILQAFGFVNFIINKLIFS